MKLSTTALAVATFMLSACATQITANYDRNPDADLSGYRTFAWISDNPHVVSATRSTNPLTSRRIMEAISGELRKKGFRLVEDAPNADFAVSFTTGARDKIEVDAYPVPYRTGWRWDSPYYGSSVSTRQYIEGTLAIDVFDNTTKSPVWHGWASKDLTQSEINDSRALIKSSVAAILSNFPSGSSDPA